MAGPRRLLGIIVLMIIFGGGYFFEMKRVKNMTMRLISVGPWLSINPSLQHTLFADMVLSNQFDSLLGADDDSRIVPNAATSWSANADRTQYEFKIDTSRRFSDGTYLSAHDFKNSWEEGLRLAPRSNNSSLLDVLYLVEGFEDFEKKGSISGIETPDAETLRIRLKSPFRMLMDHLTGARMSAFKKDSSGNYIGTGCYVFSEKSPDEIDMVPNKFREKCESLSPINLKYVEAKDAMGMLERGEVDGIVNGLSNLFSEMPKTEKITRVTGTFSNHIVFVLNGKSGRFFENPKYRRTFQSLLLREIKKGDVAGYHSPFAQVDPQTILPGQSGRLPPSEIAPQVDVSENDIDELIEATKKNPLLMYTGAGRGVLFDVVKRAGLKLDPKSLEVSRPRTLEVYYKTHEPDILPFILSVFGTDPDGIYHMLGKSGAILSPMAYRPGVAALLEQGRQLVNFEDLDPHYKKVNRAIFHEVPFVHVGYGNVVMLYRNDRLKMRTGFVRRNEGHLDVLQWK